MGSIPAVTLTEKLALVEKGKKKLLKIRESWIFILKDRWKRSGKVALAKKTGRVWYTQQWKIEWSFIPGRLLVVGTDFVNQFVVNRSMQHRKPDPLPNETEALMRVVRLTHQHNYLQPRYHREINAFVPSNLPP